MEFIIGILASICLAIAVLYLDYIVFKREKKLMELVEHYKHLYYQEFNEHYDTRKEMLHLNNKCSAYRRAIYDCIENFNATYSNTRLSFDEAKCAFVIEDIDVDDSLPTEEEITQQNENEDENQG